ncbi:uncharacterized protein LOC111270204 isoform X2 [Varroa jacobsoni]|uniref:Uncharacterized protein n=1 Tax=Varroa destructor TaxID=109461 RepID=A0A7M7K8S6_VARDE|nr:uncharacterized protein LOC111248735 [Varroa destructor]XP_022706024.1 uncharacterized protein LOC111270204 isoform X2 [Varroa jacobsoni]
MGSRSILNKTSSTIDSSRFRKKQKWYHRRPILDNAYFTNLQKGSYIAALYALVECLFMICLVVFDIYCLAEALPGSRHFRYFGISFLFVYSGNQHVRNLLIAVSVFSFIGAICLLVTSAQIISALRKEQEAKFKPWLYAMFIFTVWRFCAIMFRSIANDLYYAYHILMLLIWVALIAGNVFAYLVVLSNYQELSDITRLEDLARSKMGVGSTSVSRSVSHNSLDTFKNSMHNSSFQSNYSGRSGAPSVSSVPMRQFR